MRNFLGALGISLALHFAVVMPFYAAWARNRQIKEELMEIDYVRGVGVSRARQPATPHSAPVSKPKVQASTQPRKQETVPAKVASPPAVEASSESAAKTSRKPATGADLLADPQTGKVFIGYFNVLKRKIDQTVRRDYERAEMVGKGSVTLFFVLNSDGSLAAASALDGQSDAGLLAKDFAVQCLKKASPFDSFPKELAGLKQISR